ncbi:hypothetical protein CO663_18420 [Rhizobium anhuiense]|nr:hypothetical protein AS890_04485 [Rhizobium anhuiense bv. trifolii]PDS57293.1 hypothetical protein CO663_18420 [Rhizobium anhuiense]
MRASSLGHNSRSAARDLAQLQLAISRSFGYAISRFADRRSKPIWSPANGVSFFMPRSSPNVPSR